MTDQEIDNIEARAQTASKGEWRLQGMAIHTPEHIIAVIRTSEGYSAHSGAPSGEQATQNAAFLAAARDDVLALVRAVRFWKDKYYNPTADGT